MSLTTLTAEQLRKMRDYIPELSNRPPGFDLGAFLNTLIESLDSDLGNIVSGTATITASATNTGVIAVGAAYDAKPVVACLTIVNGSVDFVKSAVWNGSGGLTISVNTAPGGSAVATVSYIVDAR